VNLSEVIALLGLLAAGVGGALTYAYNQGRVAAKLDAVTKAIDDLKAELLRSATAQGERLGELKDAVGTLFDFKARVEATAHERERRDTKGVPISDET
jgi:hypothetical protein